MIFYVGFIAYSDFSKFTFNFFHFKFEYLIPILSIGFLTLFIKAVRQHLILHQIDIRIPFKDSLLLYFSGIAMTVTPGGIGAVIRSYYLKNKHGHKISRTFPITLIEKFHDSLAVVIIIFVSLITIKSYEAMTLASVIGIVLILIYTAVRIKNFFMLTSKMLSRIPLVNRQIDKLFQSYDTFHTLTSRRITIQCLLVSLASWGGDAIAVYLTFVAFGLKLQIAYTTVVSFSSILFGSISFLPGGVGLTEASMVGLLVKNGMELSLATSVVFMVRLVGIWYTTAIGFITMKFLLSKN